MNYQADRERLAKRQRIAELLSQQALTPSQTQTVSGRAIPKSALEGLSPIIKAMIAKKTGQDVSEKSQALDVQQAQGTKDAMSEVMEQYKGKPLERGQYGPPAQGETLRQDVPAIAPDPMGAVGRIVSDPHLADNKVAQALAGQMMKSQTSASAKPSYKVVPERVGDKWQNREIINGVKGGLIGDPYEKSSGATSISNTLGKGDSKYSENRLGGQADRMTEMSKAAESAFSELKAVDRYIAAAEKGADSGGAQPIITGVKNFLSSAGYSNEALTNTRTMQQAIGDMKINKIAQFGARGLTDKDMQIINESLPRVNTDPESRLAVARILQKIHHRTIDDFKYAKEQEKERYPGVASKIFEPRWMGEYNSRQRDVDRKAFQDKLDKKLGIKPNG